MAKNYVQSGSVLEAVAPADVSSGDGVLIGGLFGVAAGPAVSGEEMVLNLAGVWILQKKAADNVGQFAKVYWDDTNKEVTTTATDNTLIGVATLAAAATTTQVHVRLNGVSV
jgi:predicted RecA/RadA family phage recombinase